MNWMLIMVVTAIYTQGGTRSVDVTMERFATKQECIYVAGLSSQLVEKHKRSDMDTQYECVQVKEEK